MHKLKTISTFIIFLFFYSSVIAQEGIKKTDMMRENGRIYVVIAVMLTILVGLILYIVRLDKKLSKLEKED